LTERTKAVELAAVSQQIDKVREQIGKTGTEITSHIEKRDKLNLLARTLRQEIADLKKERDTLNASVKTLKQQRDEARISIRPYIEEIKTHSQKIHELKEKRSGENRHVLQKELDAIEWKIATTSLDLQEEKRLIENVKHLETQLFVYKKMDAHSKKISEIKGELKVFQDKADAFHKELTENAKKSQELHAKMQLKFAEMGKIRDDATNLHVQYLLAKEKLTPLHAEVTHLIEQKRRLQEDVREETEKSKKSKDQEIKEKLGSQARDKLQRGEKLNWQEFQLMGGSGGDSGTED
jgi:uncharacterized coiled-coil DUF342 family protein